MKIKNKDIQHTFLYMRTRLVHLYIDALKGRYSLAHWHKIINNIII